MNFRNYESARFCLHPAGNLIIAPNGWGKTNLLEAIAYCGLGKSVHFHKDEELRREGADFFRVHGEFADDGGLGLDIQISWQDSKKFLKVNGLPERQLSRIYECVKVIYSAPEDMNLVSGYPRFRRQYFDLAVSQIYPEYITILRRYLHVVRQRNNLLKGDFQAEEKKSWDLRFVELLISVIGYRKKYLELVNCAFREQYTDISTQVRDIRIEYVTHHKDDYPAEPGGIMKLLAAIEGRERYYQRSLVGAHIDDYSFNLDGHDLKTFGSQGQKRITVIILKLIQAALIEDLTRIKPILLFDDVFAELDTLHAHRISEYVDYRYQVFIASPREDICGEWNKLERLRLPGLEQ